MSRFNLFDLKKWPENEPFPKEVNAHAKEALQGFGISAACLEFYEKPGNRFYGTCYAIDGNGMLRASFEMIKGVAFKWDLINYFGKSQAHVQIYNKNVFKPKKDKSITKTQSEEKDARRT